MFKNLLLRFVINSLFNFALNVLTWRTHLFETHLLPCKTGQAPWRYRNNTKRNKILCWKNLNIYLWNTVVKSGSPLLYKFHQKAAEPFRGQQVTPALGNTVAPPASTSVSCRFSKKSHNSVLQNRKNHTVHNLRRPLRWQFCLQHTSSKGPDLPAWHPGEWHCRCVSYTSRQCRN